MSQLRIGPSSIVCMFQVQNRSRILCAMQEEWQNVRTLLLDRWRLKEFFVLALMFLALRYKNSFK